MEVAAVQQLAGRLDICGQKLKESVMREKLLKRFAILVLLFCGFQAAYGQTFCPNNINFENGNLNLWKFYTASNNGA